MLKWIVVRVAVAKVVELHELVSRGLDEERSHHLKTNRWSGKNIEISYVDKSINHLVPITKFVVAEESDTKRQKSKKIRWFQVWTCSWWVHRWLRCHLWDLVPREGLTRRDASENARRSWPSLAPSRSCRSLQLGIHHTYIEATVNYLSYLVMHNFPLAFTICLL